MNSIIDFITENDVIIMSSLLILIVFLTVIVLITDAVNSKKNNKDASEIFNNSNNNVIDAFKEELNNTDNLEYTTDLKQYDNVLNPLDSSQIKYVEEDEELEKTKAQLELKALKEELIKADLEEKAKINEEKSTTEIIDLDEISTQIDTHESSQEENAIISLDEFNKLSDRLYDLNEEIQYTDEGNEPISIEELEQLYNTREFKAIDTSNEIKEEKPNVIENKTEVPKFKSTPIISPVYGLNKEENINSLSFENTANYDKLSEEIRKTNEFLNTLKELRKNLQ